MKLMLDIDIPSPEVKITYDDNVFIVGSCFTEHIGGKLHDLKFSTIQNPNGILFDPVSVSKSLISYVENKHYHTADLFFQNELWQSWQHHSMFSGTNQHEVLEKINDSQHNAHVFLKTANWLIITLGSSFCYRLRDEGEYVANCHRAPSQTFSKHLLAIAEIKAALDEAVKQILIFNPSLKIILTISPVRHVRDGVIENNRSKARLIEVAHDLCSRNNIFYFPSYEIVIDVLRDHRFYDIDLVHPNYAATEFVFDKFSEYFIEDASRKVMVDIKKIVSAYRHKALQPTTKAHRLFLENCLLKVLKLQEEHSHIDFSKEINYFTSAQEVT